MTVATPQPHDEGNRSEREQSLHESKRNPTLGQLIAPTGLSAADVAFQANIRESTISRYWNDPDWLDKATGRTIKALIAAVPSLCLGEHLQQSALDQRRQQLTDELNGHGLTLDRAAITATTVPVQHVNAALSAASKLMERNPSTAARTMARFWGHDQSAALTLVFGQAFTDRGPLVDAAIDVASRLTQTGFHAVIGRATLGYHITRVTGTPLDLEPPQQAGHRAFVARSATLGAIKTGDLDAVDRYDHLVAGDRAARIVELYAYPSYCRDVGAGKSLWLPKGAKLNRTAAEVIREIGTEAESYLSYLARTFLPLILERDPTFAGRCHDLSAALAARRPTITNTAVATDLDHLSRHLGHTV